MNLVVNGCSFTNDFVDFPTWATYTSQMLDVENYVNLAWPAVGNTYICSTTINYIERYKPDPSNTVFVIMWSGIGRKDVQISREAFGLLHNSEEYYPVTWESNETYWFVSGGHGGSWQFAKESQLLFKQQYKYSDPQPLCEESLHNFICLENYLKQKGYRFLFTNYCNTWLKDPHGIAGDYTLGYFCPKHVNFDFTNWFFVDEQRNCLGDFALQRGMLDDTRHPTKKAQELFAEQVVVPAVNQLVAQG